MPALVREEGVLLQERPAPLRIYFQLGPGAAHSVTKRAPQISRQPRAGVALPLRNRVAPPQSGVVQDRLMFLRIPR